MDAWAAYFEQARIAGKGDLIEDDNFDLNQILDDLERQNGDAADYTEAGELTDPPPDDWEEPETWG
ncbi:MAG: hypothetical protein EOM92_18075, partial [Gammaproteobacteria bacterium]|nr:hypothetical protein [Gammaproteobacteria bacterium]